MRTRGLSAAFDDPVGAQRGFGKRKTPLNHQLRPYSVRADGHPPLLGFEVAPGYAAVVAHVPEAADLGWIGSRCHVEVGGTDTVDGDAGRIPGVDVGAQVAGLPAERAGAVKGEGRGDGGCHRAARAASGRRGRSRCAGSGWDTGGQGAGLRSSQ